MRRGYRVLADRSARTIGLRSAIVDSLWRRWGRRRGSALAPGDRNPALDRGQLGAGLGDAVLEPAAHLVEQPLQLRARARLPQPGARRDQITALVLDHRARL